MISGLTYRWIKLSASLLLYLRLLYLHRHVPSYSAPPATQSIHFPPFSTNRSNHHNVRSGHIMMPAKNIHIYNTTILSRNVCLGSATFGGIYDLVVEDCTIGDDEGSSPWAIKYKSHQSYPGRLTHTDSTSRWRICHSTTR